ncbi:MAG TPA: WecB/TagA/CpsF family glycosyltransferase [Fimbriimonadaceae bacterium]|nr:WecB/TagA/CpsF family glycosyltransferase [Fimbriimonadaceae bacterium]
MIAKLDMERPRRISILGAPVDRVTMREALALMESFVAEGRPHMVVTADASGLAQAQSDPSHLEIIREADLVTPDSVGVMWAAKRSGEPLPERVSGVDIVDRVCALSADKGYRIYFLGAAPGVAELAAEKMRLKHVGCNIVGARHGYFPAESDEVVAREVAESKPDFLFVAMGIPRQEKFIRATMGIIKARVAVGVGGSFDVFSGRTKRAPKVVQAIKMEWAWRLVLNPKKYAKVMALPKFILLVWRSPK